MLTTVSLLGWLKQRAVATTAAITLTITGLSVLHDVQAVQPIVRKLLYLAFSAMFVMSGFRLFGHPRFAQDRLSDRRTPPRHWADLLALAVPIIAVGVFALIALAGGLGLNNVPSARNHSVYVQAGGGWLSMREERPEDLWNLFHPARYYQLKTPREYEMGHFRPLKFLFLRLVSGSLLTASLYAICVHALNSMGVTFLARRWGGDRWIAAVSGALFALHPLPWNSVGLTDDLKYAEGTTLLLAALVLYDVYAHRHRPLALAAAALCLVLSCLFVESFVGGVVFIILLTIIFTKSGIVSRRQAITAAVVFGATSLLIIGGLLFVEITFAPGNRLGMLATNWKRLLLTVVFEPQFAFLHPLEARYITSVAQVLAVPLAPLAGIVFSSSWSAYSGAAWMASSFTLGPALAFFEMTTGGWSGGRLAYGPSFLLCLAFGMVAPPNARTAVWMRWGLLFCAIAACLLTFERVIRY